MRIRPESPGFQATVRSLEAKLPPHVEGEILVRTRPGAELDSLAADYGAVSVEPFSIPEVMRDSFTGSLALLRLPAGVRTAESLAAAEDDPRLQYACSNDLLYALEDARVPDDLDPRLWGLHNTGQGGGKPDADIDAPEAWALTTGSPEGPVVAVVDTGVDYRHPDLAANMWTNPRETKNGKDDDGNGVVDDLHGFNALDGSGDPMDDHRHGTHVAGTIAATGNNGRGVVGVNWRGRVLAAKFLDKRGRGETAGAIRALLYATGQGARITSNSWGGDGFNEALRDVLQASPALHLCAAGNSRSDNDSDPHYPSSYDLPNLVAVAATDRDDTLAGFSSYGATSVDLGAPGVDILSTTPNGSYAVLSGTSMATPLVSGVAALIATRFPGASNAQIRDRLLYSTDPLPSLAGKTVTGGRLNALRALEDDRVAPGTPAGLAPTAVDFRQVRLGWTAGGDDGAEGRASAYLLRRADRPIAAGPVLKPGEIPFDQATPVATGAPGAAGSAEAATVPFFPSTAERPVYFALAAVDNVGNRSEVVTGGAVVPAARVAFDDDAETPGGWTPENAWARVAEDGRGMVWTDSPNGPYESNRNDSLTSAPLSLAGVKAPVLLFESRYHLEDWYDKVHVEVTADGTTWTELDSLTGKSGWQLRSYDLSAFEGKDVRVRFRLETDSSTRKDGFYLDRVMVAGSPVGQR